MKDNKKRFIEIFNANIKREGADKLLEYLLSSQSDFFIAPASTRYHGNYEGGLVEHSLNVYDCLVDYVSRKRVHDEYKLSFTNESIAIVSLLHDLCKINCYKKGSRNVKDEKGVWQTVATYEFDDNLPYGHGEKSVYIITGYMKLSREEAFAIRYHMGFTGTEDKRSIGDAFALYPLSFALCTADMEAAYFLEGNKN
jgi:hypothetical protein